MFRALCLKNDEDDGSIVRIVLNFKVSFRIMSLLVWARDLRVDVKWGGRDMGGGGGSQQSSSVGTMVFHCLQLKNVGQINVQPRPTNHRFCNMSLVFGKHQIYSSNLALWRWGFGSVSGKGYQFDFWPTGRKKKVLTNYLGQEDVKIVRIYQKSWDTGLRNIISKCFK